MSFSFHLRGIYLLRFVGAEPAVCGTDNNSGEHAVDQTGTATDHLGGYTSPW